MLRKKKRTIAVCPKCEKRHELTSNVAQAWCNHRKTLPSGKLSKIVEKIKCKIVRVDE